MLIVGARGARSSSLVARSSLARSLLASSCSSCSLARRRSPTPRSLVLLVLLVLPRRRSPILRRSPTPQRPARSSSLASSSSLLGRPARRRLLGRLARRRFVVASSLSSLRRRFVVVVARSARSAWSLAASSPAGRCLLPRHRPSVEPRSSLPDPPGLQLELVNVVKPGRGPAPLEAVRGMPRGRRTARQTAAVRWTRALYAAALAGNALRERLANEGSPSRRGGLRRAC